MEKEAGRRKSLRCHIAILPYITQGHINPMLQLAKRFASKNVKVTVTSFVSVGKCIPAESESISFQPIFDDEKDNPYTGQGGYWGFIQRFEAVGSRNLVNFIKNLEKSDCPVKCLIFDPNVHWGINVAKQMGIASAHLSILSCTMISSLYPMYYELKEEPLPFPALPLPDLPEMRSPSWDVSSTCRFPPLARKVIELIAHIGQPDWILFLTFQELEEDAVKWMSSNFGVPVRMVGPTIPSYYLDKRIEADTTYGFNAFKPNEEIDYMKWLDTKQSCSVVYVSFGSNSSLPEQQIAEISEGLERSKSQFLWVGRETELLNKMEKDGYLADNGLVVPWCSQLDVLSHPAVGCFVTHCGINSTMEAISCGVAVVPIPLVFDQTANAYCAEKMWGVGVVPREDGERGGLVRASEIHRCIREVMDGEEIKKNLIKWKRLAKEALSEGGSSDKSIDEIIDHLVNRDNIHTK